MPETITFFAAAHKSSATVSHEPPVWRKFFKKKRVFKMNELKKSWLSTKKSVSRTSGFILPEIGGS